MPTRCLLAGLCLLLLSVAPASGAQYPVPKTVSPQLQGLIGAGQPPYWNAHPKTAEEWKVFAQGFANVVLPGLPALREHLGVSLATDTIGGVPVYILSPKSLPDKHADRVLLNFHGGGYVLGAGVSGTMEATLMAGIGKFTVIMPDYRMVPDFPYPAAMDDALAVYCELLRTTAPEKIGVFGTSTGGAMSLALVLRAKAEKLPLPAAIAAGTPWADLTKTGDTYFTHEGLDNILVGYDGWLGEAAKAYAAGHDLKDPFLSPVYGDVSGFPPVMLTSGTRDLFLSNTVRMHLKLRMAGIPADLIVFEGMSHAQYHMVPDAPETRFHFSELAKFFDSCLD